MAGVMAGAGGVVGPIVYRLGRDPFKVERRVRLPLGLWLVPGIGDGYQAVEGVGEGEKETGKGA